MKKVEKLLVDKKSKKTNKLKKKEAEVIGDIEIPLEVDVNEKKGRGK